jgi:hypothetical protein
VILIIKKLCLWCKIELRQRSDHGVLEGTLRGGEAAAREGRQRPAGEQGTGAAVVVVVVVVAIAGGGFYVLLRCTFLFFCQCTTLLQFCFG